jgi:hypothetical protein
MEQNLCALGHTWFLRSHDPKSELPYEFECWMCSAEHIFSKEDLRPFPKHPLCLEGKHYWGVPCTCCYPGQLQCERLCGEWRSITPDMMRLLNGEIIFKATA